MYLHRIELHGFKSFADRTQVQFDPGVTAIVGPNGCGKSNIIDAVRWVLGEQRARLLRSDKMESVIFNGTSSRRALGMAEVALTIHNTRGVLPTEYSEVTVGRRLYRSGESEYVLNGTTCRLKDILDLFMDTGMGAGAYSVIELKMIEDLLSESPQDRRRLFEEAAGITKYKLRRAQALRRLDQTQADLDRLRDLTEEIDRNVRSLSRQARKAERHKDLSEQLRTLELHLAAADHARLAAERQRVETEARALENQLAERSAQLQTREAEAEARGITLVEREQALAAAEGALRDHAGRVSQADAEARLAAERRTAAEQALERLAREAHADEDRRAASGREAEALAAGIQDAAAAEAEAAATEAARADDLRSAQAAAQEARSRLAQAEGASGAAATALRDAERRLETQRSRHGVLAGERQQVEARLAETAGAGEQLERQRGEAEQHAEAAWQRRADAETALAELEDRRAALDERLEAIRARLSAARRRHDAARAEAEVIGGLLDSYEGFSDAVQTLLAEPAWATAPRTVTDLLTCPPELRRAVDAALGPFADCLVVATEAEAHAGIARLRADDAGRATFLVLERLPERGPAVLSPTPPGATPLAQAVSANDPAHQRLVRTLLANHFVIDNLERAAAHMASHPLARLVTPAGEWAGSGMMRAGSEERTASAERIGRREQLEAAQNAQEAAHQEASTLESELAEVLAERDGLGVDRARTALREAERELADASRAATDAQSRAENEARRRDDLAERLATLTRQADEIADTGDLQRDVDEARAALEAADARRSAARDEAATAEAAARDALARHSEARVAAAAARNQAQTVRRDRDRALQLLAELDDRAAEREIERQRVEATREQAADAEQRHRAAAEDLRDGLEDLQGTVQTASENLVEVKAAISDADLLLRELRRLREETREALSEGRLRLTENATRLEGLGERIWSEHGVALTEIEPAPDDFDPAGARQELPRLRDQLRNLGAVNELALESYEEEKERLDFLLGQQADLEQAEASLRSTIREINTTARQRFEETFAAVREAFQKLFQDLFGEDAMADIQLAGDDPLEDDIDIRARPKGKKPSAITQLSGGEKTLTAIALLFAIYLVKPSPFCILDEVDAPLDDANVERFMRLIRSFAHSTQFILVTHNKLTMEAADRMYGVTMQEQGVSRLVGVRFSEVLPEAA